MSEYTSIPARVNGDPIPTLSDVAPAMNRNVNQNATTDGIKNTHGLPKFQVSLTFKTLKDRASFLRTVGAYQLNPAPFNLGYDLGSDVFTLTGCVVSAVQAQSDQDGSASLQLTIMAEALIDEGA